MTFQNYFLPTPRRTVITETSADRPRSLTLIGLRVIWGMTLGNLLNYAASLSKFDLTLCLDTHSLVDQWHISKTKSERMEIKKFMTKQQTPLQRKQGHSMPKGIPMWEEPNDVTKQHLFSIPASHQLLHCMSSQNLLLHNRRHITCDYRHKHNPTQHCCTNQNLITWFALPIMSLHHIPPQDVC